MHIPDGLIPFPQYIIYWIIVLPPVYLSLRWARREMDDKKAPLLAVLAAGIFAIQAVNLPVGMGTSGHMVGAVLAAIILGSPYAGLLILTLVLIVQAFVFYDGGITTLGANLFNMGLVSSWSGYYTYRGLRGKMGAINASFAGAWVGLFLSAIAATLQIYFAGAFPLVQALIVMGLLHAVIGVIGEGFITAVVVRYLLKARPDIMNLEQPSPISKNVLAATVLAVFVIAMAAPYIASTNPDGLERAMEILMGEEEIKTDPAIHYSAPLQDYSIPGLGRPGEAAALAGGTLMLLIAGIFLVKSKRKKQEDQVANAVGNDNGSGGWVSKDQDWGTPYIIETRDLIYYYHSGSAPALNGINFCVKPGERIVLLGANGAGKSTLFKHFNGIFRPASGEVLIKGQPVSKYNIKDVRRTVGVVFQNPDDQIFSPTVAQDVAFGPMNLGLPLPVVEKRVKKALEMVHLTGYEDRAPHHLSGGEKKLVAIAGILAMKPEVIVLDEPTSGLDPGAASRLIRMIMEMNRNLGITVIIATHEVDLVPGFAQKVYVLSAGRVLGEGSSIEIFNRPDLIAHTHLRLPLVGQLMKQLKEAHMDVEMELTVEGARDEILRASDRMKS